MKWAWATCTLIVGLALSIASDRGAFAQKAGGILKVTHRDSPASMSIHDEGTYSVIAPMMGVFNNLVLYDQHVEHNSLATIRPELATEWAWDDDGTSLTLTPLEFDLLVTLARRPRQVFSRETLLQQVWGYRHVADTRLVNVHVQRLRAKVEKDPEQPRIVLTVRGVGYRAGPP